MKQLAVIIDPAAIGLPTQFSNLGGVISAFLPAIVALAGLAAFMLFIFGGLRYLTAGGDSKATAEAVKIITNAVIGLAIVFGSYWAIQIVETVFGLNITRT